MTIELTGKVMGHVDQHTPATLKATFEKAYVALKLDDGSVYTGTLDQLPTVTHKLPTVLFMHGSSGVNPAIREFAQHLAQMGWALIAPDSMQTEDRITYSSPIARETYEKIHALRYEELQYAVQHVKALPFLGNCLVLAGTSEGGVSVARFENQSEIQESARLILSWSCENNYHVTEHRTRIPQDCPVLNIMSGTDPYFSRANSYLDNDSALGHAAQTLKDHKDATIVLLPGAPHTLFNLPQARTLIDAFLNRISDK